MKTTNYYNTFIEVAEDCPATSGEMPPTRENAKTVAAIQFEMLFQRPYQYTSDDVMFNTYAMRNELSKLDEVAERAQFFSKGQPCFRSSPLTKRYGWGVHSDDEGKIAIYASGTEEYKRLANDKSLKQVKAMRSKRV